MAYKLILESQARKFLKKMRKKNPQATRTIIKNIVQLKNDPYTPRPKCDIDKVKGSINEYRLRVGKVRAEYIINDNKIKNPTLKGGVCYGPHSRAIPVFLNSEII